MKDIWAKARLDQEILHFKNFQQPDITWEDALKFVYDLSFVGASQKFKERADRDFILQLFGGVIFNKGYFLFEESNLFKYFNGIEELMSKVNGGVSGKDCLHYTRSENFGTCSCNQQWHIQTLRLSIGYHEVLNHNDPCDVLYWQVLGNSTWVMNDSTEYVLEPGDLLYFNKDDIHRVLQDGPRAGVIIDGSRQNMA
jgi:mannose-6-phosphate isomerase-like protein (cupin superfamily)